MGAGIAKTLRNNGFTIHVCDVRPGVAEAFVADGGTAHATTASLAAFGATTDWSSSNTSGVITLVTNTGWTLVGLMTVVATAGTAQLFRARKSGDGTWVLYRYG
jgi:hypothetical protein